jgi:hypothetical protein
MGWNYNEVDWEMEKSSNKILKKEVKGGCGRKWEGFDALLGKCYVGL